MSRAFSALVCVLWATAAQAWDYTPGLPCLLTHEVGDTRIELTHDPSAPLYTISLTRPSGFTPAPVFAIRFIGPFPLTITTTRHQLSADGNTLTVTDTGFGNVLNGLQANRSAIAQLGDQNIPIPLAGAEAPTAAFRICQPQPGV